MSNNKLQLTTYKYGRFCHALRQCRLIRHFSFFIFHFSLFAIVLLHFCSSTIANAVPIPVVPEIPYVRIESPQAMLYEKTSENGGAFRPLTTLPASYYALMTEDYDIEYYRVTYYDLEGYVKKTDAALVDYEPTTKFASAALTVSADVTGVNLRARPDHTADNILAEIKRGETLAYYGKVVGSSPIVSAGSEWYYVRYEGNDEMLKTDTASVTELGIRNEELGIMDKRDDIDTIQRAPSDIPNSSFLIPNSTYGYLYAPYVTADAILENPGEKVMYEPAPEPIISGPSGGELSLPPATMALIIGVLCVPAAVVMFLLFKKPPEERKKSPRGF